MELEIIDVLDTCYHIDGVTYTNVCLMSDGSVQGRQYKMTEEEALELDFPF